MTLYVSGGVGNHVLIEGTMGETVYLNINPIENLWDKLGRHVSIQNITSKSQLKEVLQQEWQKIESSLQLVYSMQNCRKEVLRVVLFMKQLKSIKTNGTLHSM